ncbi:MAG: hypothetical protein JWP06_262 [Candidatus Saccharibacteria bacterium]|nr:hypothetical protein [Candidatus Saccharibacteria bacterium]
MVLSSTPRQLILLSRKFLTQTDPLAKIATLKDLHDEDL